MLSDGSHPFRIQITHPQENPMRLLTHPVAVLTALVAMFATLDAPAQQNSTDELDAFWAEASRTVAEGDFEGYAATYHEDAVLVNLSEGTSYPISAALDGWKQGFDDTAAGRMTAGVEFRFSQRLNDETTAHETGIFRYHFQLQGEEEESYLVHFEGLLVKKDGAWKMVMEYQKEAASPEEWEALAN